MSTFITKRQHKKLIYIHVHLYLIIFLCSYSKIYKSYLNLSLVKVIEALKSLFKVKVNVVKEDIIVLNLILILRNTSLSIFFTFTTFFHILVFSNFPRIHGMRVHSWHPMISNIIIVYGSGKPGVREHWRASQKWSHHQWSSGRREKYLQETCLSAILSINLEEGVTLTLWFKSKD